MSEPTDDDRAVERHAGDRAEDWDHRYTDGGHTLWSGEPNPALVAETEHLEAGIALDLGCGEGADAIWLARRGWEVTAVDISAVALERAAEAATTAGVQINWVRADLPSEPLPSASFDLVTAMYPAFRHTPGDDVIRAILDAVAPGGTLLVVHHCFEGPGGHRPAGFDPADYVGPSDIANHLHDGWTIEIHSERDRVRPAGSPGPDVPDLVLRARRAR
jgi:SAM-dependent methyltransferase